MALRTLRSSFILVPIFALIAFNANANDLVENTAKPNVLLICVDDLKPAIGCYGDKAAKTPNIDRLASVGLRCASTYCNQAVCSPSRNALLTSLRPQTLGIYDLPTNFRKSRPDAVTLGQYFQQHGYHTQALGKIFHVGHGNQEDAASWDVPHFRPKAGQYALDESKPAAGATAKKGTDEPKGAATESADVSDETYADGVVAAEAIERLKQAKQSDKPFFMAVGFVKPHLPFVAPKRYWDMHDPSSLPQPPILELPAGAPSYAPQLGGELRNYRDMPASPKPIDAQTTKQLIHGYYAATSYMDAQVGKLLDTLDRLSLRENTIVVLWGDHGWHLGDHGMWCKHTNYEQATRIPLIVSVPGAKSATTQALIETVDIYPTLAELAGLPVPQGLDGKSFAKLLSQPNAPHRDHAIHVYPRSNLIGRAIRTSRYRLVEWKSLGARKESAVGSKETSEYELYDYKADPNESRNLIDELPQIAEQLKSLLAQHPEALPQIKTAQATSEESKVATAKPKNSGQDRNAMFNKRDKDSDGKLTHDEFLSGQPDPEQAKLRFPKFDKNQDGSLTREEFVNSGK